MAGPLALVTFLGPIIVGIIIDEMLNPDRLADSDKDSV